MDRHRATTALVIVLAVVVVGTAAAGLVDSERAAGETSPGLGDGNGSGVGSGNASGIGFNTSATAPGWAVPESIVRLFIGGVLAISVLASLVYVVAVIVDGEFAELRKQLVDALTTVIGVVLVLAGLLVLVFVLAELFGEGGGGMLGGGPSAASGTGGSSSQSALTSPELPGVVIVAGALLFVGLIVLVSERGDDDGTEPAPPGLGNTDPAVPPERRQPFLFFGDATEPSAENAVYRAWDDLASAVGSTGTNTPAEIERAAVEAGYDADAVGELTTMFREVRYGHAPVDGRHERRARELTGHLHDGGAPPGGR